MQGAVELVEVMRGGHLESVHRGHAVIADADGKVIEAWGDPDCVVYPRSAIKMIQALPLLESGAGADLTEERLALACASHSGAAMHSGAVALWLADLGLSEADLRCGPQMPQDRTAREQVICSGSHPDQTQNNCSGKHAGFLMLGRHLGGGPEYVDPDHPVQRAVRTAFEEVTGEASPYFGVDGCSAPNFAASLAGVARAMAGFATAHRRDGARDKAMVRLREAMMARPDLVAGEGRACTAIMRAAHGRAAVKTGAEGVYTAILPEQGLGIALKIADGTTRAAECAVTALLVRLGVLEAGAEVAADWMAPRIRSRRGAEVGEIRPVASLLT